MTIEYQSSMSITWKLWLFWSHAS